MSHADTHLYRAPSERETRADPPPAPPARQRPLPRVRSHPDSVATSVRRPMAVHGVPSPPVE